MILSNQEQLQQLFYYLGFGVLIELYYELFRLRRTTADHKPVGVFLLDILFCTGSGTALFLFAIGISGGQLRLATIAACIVGFFAARVSIGRWFFTAMRYVFRFCGRGIRKIEKFLSFFRKKVTIFLKKGLRSVKRLVYNHRV